MIDNFFQILHQLPPMVETPLTRKYFLGDMPFKVQENFDNPLFEDQIYVYDLEKWFSLLGGYFYAQNVYDSENITFVLLRSLPHIKD